MKTIEKIVYAEASTKSIFVVSEERYSLETLMKYPEICLQLVFLQTFLN